MNIGMLWSVQRWRMRWMTRRIIAILSRRECPSAQSPTPSRGDEKRVAGLCNSEPRVKTTFRETPKMPKKSKNQPVTNRDALVKCLLGMHSAGTSWREIGRDLKVPAGTLCRIANTDYDPKVLTYAGR